MIAQGYDYILRSSLYYKSLPSSNAENFVLTYKIKSPLAVMDSRLVCALLRIRIFVISHYVIEALSIFVVIGVCMSKTTVLRGAKVQSHAWVQSAIIGWKSTVGKWVSQSHIMYIHVVI